MKILLYLMPRLWRHSRGSSELPSARDIPELVHNKQIFTRPNLRPQTSVRKEKPAGTMEVKNQRRRACRLQSPLEHLSVPFRFRGR